MKRLVLIRHAKSSWKDAHMKSDKERTLNSRGKRDAPMMASRLIAKSILPDFIVSSDSARTRMTVSLMLETYKRAIDLVFTSKLYHCDVEDIVETIVELDDAIDCVFLYGHNPSINEFASIFIPGFSENVPTCGVISFQLSSRSWQDFIPKNVQLEFYDYPKSNA